LISAVRAIGQLIHLGKMPSTIMPSLRSLSNSIRVCQQNLPAWNPSGFVRDQGVFKLLMSDPTHDRFVHGTFIIKDRGND
jgi:hypothetical protein